jgi:hypothetical protein
MTISLPPVEKRVAAFLLVPFAVVVVAAPVAAGH